MKVHKSQLERDRETALALQAARKKAGHNPLTPYPVKVFHPHHLRTCLETLGCSSRPAEATFWMSCSRIQSECCCVAPCIVDAGLCTYNSNVVLRHWARPDWSSVRRIRSCTLPSMRCCAAREHGQAPPQLWGPGRGPCPQEQAGEGQRGCRSSCCCRRNSGAQHPAPPSQPCHPGENYR